MDKVQVDVFDDGAELRHAIQLGLLLAPVQPRPSMRELLGALQRDALHE
jgi:hypothetical protein